MRKNLWLMVETILIFTGSGGIALLIQQTDWPSPLRWSIYLPILLFQGLWFYRLYVVGHEASHHKLFPQNRFLNDLAGSIALIPLMVPINIYRKIHYFHHGFNRKNDHTSALDTFVLKKKPNLIRKIWCYFIWYLSVFVGGFFLHSLVSVILFLFIPPKFARKISPAFNGWSGKDQIISISLFAIGLGFHFGTYFLMGQTAYLYLLGFPMLSFAWVLSLLLYIFHYNTTKGDRVRYNVRAVKPVPVISWILMNFNEHATHHLSPNIPWYDLPQNRKSLPKEFDKKNQVTHSFFRAILNQFKGPIITYEDTH